MNKIPKKLAELIEKGMKSPGFAEGYKAAQKDDDWDCGCPRGAEDECVSIICPRK